MKRIFSLLLRIVVTLSLLFLLFRWINPLRIVGVISRANIACLFLSLSLFAVIYIIGFFRWRILLDSVGVFPPAKRLAVSYFGGIFFNMFMPSTVGGDVVRILDLTNHSRKRKEIAATVLVDRLCGFFALGAIALLSLCAGHRYIRGLGLFLPVLSLFTFLFLAAAVVFDKKAFSRLQGFIPFRRLREKIVRLQEEVFCFRGRPFVLIKAFVLSLVIQVLFILGYQYIFLALGKELNLIYSFIFVPIVAVLTVFPVSFGGLGVRDISSAFLFGKVGVSKDIAVAASLLNFGFLALIGCLCGLVYFYALCGRWTRGREAKIG